VRTPVPLDHASPLLMEKPHVSRRDKSVEQILECERAQGMTETTRGKGARAVRSCAKHRWKFQTRLRRLPTGAAPESSPCSALAKELPNPPWHRVGKYE